MIKHFFHPDKKQQNTFDMKNTGTHGAAAWPVGEATYRRSWRSF